VRLIAALTERARPGVPGGADSRASKATTFRSKHGAGVAVPKGTPRDVIATLEAAVRKTVSNPEFAAGCERLGARPAFMGAADFGRLIVREDGELARLMELIGMKKQP